MKVPFMSDGKSAWIVRTMANYCLANIEAFHGHLATDARNDDVPVPSQQDLQDMLHCQETKET